MNPLAELAMILTLGAAAQLAAARLRIPAILPLLAVGVVVGPLLGAIDVPALFGRMLAPFVSLAVALILFEGGLTLRLAELRGTGRIVRNLVTIGAAITWAIVGVAACIVGGLPADLAALTGAVLALTGPTVVMPMVRHVRPSGPTGAILRWEGILIDPIGALLALLVFEVVLAPEDHGPVEIALIVLRTLVVGGGTGFGAGSLLATAIARGWVPDRLLVPMTMATVVALFGLANTLQAEAGLLAVTTAGMVLANWRGIDVHRITQFKEDLGTVLLAVLFVVLAANLPRSQLLALSWRHFAVVAIAIAVARPLAVLAATAGSSLRRADRLFLMGLAPRGIVAAAVSSEFAMQLERSGRTDATQVVTQVFATIAGTVLFYGLFTPRLAQWLGLASGRRQGVLFVGASRFVRDLATALQQAGVGSLLVDTNLGNTLAARTSGLRSWHGSILSERFLDEVDLGGLGHVCAMTGSDEVNLLAVRRLQETFGREGLHLLAPRQRPDSRFGVQPAGDGGVLFAPDATAQELDRRTNAGASIRSTNLTEKFGYADYLAQHADRVLPLFAIGPAGELAIATTTTPLRPGPGWTVLGLVVPANVAAEVPAATGPQRDDEDRAPAPPG